MKLPFGIRVVLWREWYWGGWRDDSGQWSIELGPIEIRHWYDPEAWMPR